MTPFKASNGYKVQCTENDLFIKSPDDPIFVCVPGNENIQALREFFAQERCDDMPFRHGDCWVFPRDESCGHRRVLVVDVVDESCHTYSEGPARSAQQAHSRPSLEAAVAWFDAHPEPKPWLDAQTGEVWSISDGYADGLAICRREEQGYGDYHPYFYGPNFDGIHGDALTAGTRLEVQL